MIIELIEAKQIKKSVSLLHCMVLFDLFHNQNLVSSIVIQRISAMAGHHVAEAAVEGEEAGCASLASGA